MGTAALAWGESTFPFPAWSSVMGVERGNLPASLLSLSPAESEVGQKLLWSFSLPVGQQGKQWQEGKRGKGKGGEGTQRGRGFSPSLETLKSSWRLLQCPQQCGEGSWEQVVQPYLQCRVLLPQPLLGNPGSTSATKALAKHPQADNYTESHGSS